MTKKTVGTVSARVKTLLSELLLEQHSLAGMLQVLDCIEECTRAVRDAVLKVFGTDNDNGGV